MKYNLKLLLSMILLNLFNPLVLTEGQPMNASLHQHAAAGEKVVKVSVVKNETSVEKNGDNYPQLTHSAVETPIEKALVPLDTKDHKNEGKKQLSTSTSAPGTTKEKPREHLDFDNMLGTLKTSRNMLSKLNNILKKKEVSELTTITAPFEKILAAKNTENPSKLTSASHNEEKHNEEINNKEPAETDLANSSDSIPDVPENLPHSTSKPFSKNDKNGEDMEDMFIVPKQLLNEYIQHKKINDKQDNLKKSINELKKLLETVDALPDEPNPAETTSKDIKKNVVTSKNYANENFVLPPKHSEEHPTKEALNDAADEPRKVLKMIEEHKRLGHPGYKMPSTSISNDKQKSEVINSGLTMTMMDHKTTVSKSDISKGSDESNYVSETSTLSSLLKFLFGNPPANELNNTPKEDVKNQKKLRQYSYEKNIDLLENSKLPVFPPILRNMPDETEFVILLPGNGPHGTKKDVCKLGYAYHSGKMVNGNAPAKNADECLNQCNTSPGCKFWDFGENYCRLRSNNGKGQQVSRSYTSGPKYCKFDKPKRIPADKMGQFLNKGGVLTTKDTMQGNIGTNEKPMEIYHPKATDEKEMIRGNIHPVNRHALHATDSDEHGILNSVGNFFGAIGKGVSNAASWMWEAIKSPFTK